MRRNTRTALIKFNSVVRVAASKESYKVSGDPPKGSIIERFEICRRYHASDIEWWRMSRGQSRWASVLELVDRRDYSVETGKEMGKEMFFVLKTALNANRDLVLSLARERRLFR